MGDTRRTLRWPERDADVTTAKAERRLAAIVAADVVGYSRLMGLDEEGTLQALKDLRTTLIDPLIDKHGGHLVKTTGDGLLLEFSSVIQAVACAVAVQQQLAERNSGSPDQKRILLRIGINLGDVIVDGGDVFGDGVNIAARLEQLARPGGICVSDDVYRHVSEKLDVEFADAGRKRLKNIARPIRVYRIDATSPRASSTSALAGRRRTRRWLSPALAGAGALVLIAGAMVWLTPGLMPGPDRMDRNVTQSRPTAAKSFPIVAVLPFANQTGDKQRDYFADGFTDELIGALGRFNTIRVIGHNAVAAYKDRAVAAANFAASLGADYLVEGAVRSATDSLRVSARLTDSQSTVLWSDQFDGSLSDIFQFQNAISRRIAGTLAASITQLEGQKSLRRPEPNRSAHDLILRARAIGYAGSRKTNREFRQLMAKAIEVDPNYATAHALLAEAIYARVALGWTEFATRDAQKGETHARKAIALAPGEPDGHRVLGRFHLLRAEFDQAKYELERAIEINPSDSAALATLGTAKMFSGDAAGAIEGLELALKYNPALEPIYVFALGMSYYIAERHEDAIALALRGLAQFSDFPRFHLVAGAAAARLGQTDRAKTHAREIRARLPFLNLDDFTSRFRNPRDAAYLKEGLRLAGF